MQNPNSHTPADTTPGVDRRPYRHPSQNPLQYFTPNEVYELVDDSFFWFSRTPDDYKDFIFDMTSELFNSDYYGKEEANVLVSFYRFFQAIQARAIKIQNEQFSKDAGK